MGHKFGKEQTNKSLLEANENLTEIFRYFEIP
jgi:hypothetical protein